MYMGFLNDFQLELVSQTTIILKFALKKSYIKQKNF